MEVKGLVGEGVHGGALLPVMAINVFVVEAKATSGTSKRHHPWITKEK
jgi:hypothetical protein